eukprot:Polyplicarium_translucidae@DN4008_c0_g1_i1.p1
MSDFGAASASMQPYTDFIKATQDSKLKAVKAASASLLSVVYRHAGEAALKPVAAQARGALRDEMRQICQRSLGTPIFRPCRRQADPVPSSYRPFPSGDSDGRRHLNEVAEERVLAELGDHNAARRRDALRQLRSVLEKLRDEEGVQPRDLLPWIIALRFRLQDTVKPVAVEALAVALELGQALGPFAQIYGRVMIPSIVTHLPKKTRDFRDVCIPAVEAWLVWAGPEVWLSGVS